MAPPFGGAAGSGVWNSFGSPAAGPERTAPASRIASSSRASLSPSTIADTPHVLAVYLDHDHIGRSRRSNARLVPADRSQELIAPAPLKADASAHRSAIEHASSAWRCSLRISFASTGTPPAPRPLFGLIPYGHSPSGESGSDVDVADHTRIESRRRESCLNCPG